MNHPREESGGGVRHAVEQRAAERALAQVCSCPRQHDLVVAFWEIGRVERTLLIIEWLLDIDMREQEIGKAELARRLGWHLPAGDGAALKSTGRPRCLAVGARRRH